MYWEIQLFGYTIAKDANHTQKILNNMYTFTLHMHMYIKAIDISQK